MAVRIKFDNTHNVIQPTFVLATRSGHKLGSIPATNITVSDSFNSRFDLEFQVNLYDNGKKYHLWDKITDFKLVWCKEWDVWFEMYVTVQDDDDTVKNVSCVSLGEAELSQTNLYNIEINTENDIARDDYSPTIIYNEVNPKASLLHRIMEKAPHYKIQHVDVSIAGIQRTFTFDNTSLYDAFQTIAEEIDCIFVINSGTSDDGSISRTISVYDLESYCVECGHRDNFSGKCPKCESENILTGYGQDTTVFVSTENLADSITLKTDTDSVKNCFRLKAGDELLTSTVMSCNPNGSQYIWYISDETKKDMSEELINKLKEYDETYAYYYDKHELTLSGETVQKYNDLIAKYHPYKEDLHTLPASIVGYSALMNAYYDTIDLYLFLHDSFMPSPELSDTTAALQATKLNSLSSVAVQDLSRCSSSTASSAVLSVAKTIVDPRYQVKVKSGEFSDNIWSGVFTVTNYSDETDTADSATITVTISDDYETFVRQKLDKILKNAQDDENANDIVSLFKLPLDSFTTEITKYCLTSLNTFYDSCQSCIDLLIEQGVADKETWANEDDLYNKLYLNYYDKLIALQNEIKVRESEIAIVVGAYDIDGNLESEGIQTLIQSEKAKIQGALDMENFLGEKLWLEFISYKREDTYSNSNYISDGLNNGELFNRALEFIEVAKKEIYKSSTLQHSISSTLKNLLVMKEFEPIVDKFSVGNWIRLKIDNEIYRLRLIYYSIDFDDLENISVEFSDVKKYADGVSDGQSILNQAASMASSYDAIARQANQGSESNKQLENWTTKGLALTKMKIIDNADNQNIVWDSHGLLCREYNPVTDDYDDKQLKIINKGLYLTNDNWRTSKAGIGNFNFYNPKTGQMEEGYGVIADKLVGNFILSEEVGIYNENNSIELGKNGLVITADGTSGDANTTALTIQKKTLDKDNNEVVTPLMYLDSNGNLIMTGSLEIRASSDDSINTIDDLCKPDRFQTQINTAISNESLKIDESIRKNCDDISQKITEELNTYKDEVKKYMEFNEDEGLIISSDKNNFKTVINDKGIYFKDGDITAAYINNNQLFIPNAVIENILRLGKFVFSPRADNGVSLIWQED